MKAIKIDPNLVIRARRTYKCCNGFLARIYAINCGMEYSIHGATSEDGGKTWVSETWLPNGACWRENSGWDIAREVKK